MDSMHTSQAEKKAQNKWCTERADECFLPEHVALANGVRTRNHAGRSESACREQCPNHTSLTLMCSSVNLWEFGGLELHLDC